jgi:large repetitive protein
MKVNSLFQSFSVLFSIFFYHANAQQASVSTFGDITGIDGSLSYSIGEPLYINFSSQSGNVNQGVQQPEVNVSVAVKVYLDGAFNPITGLMRDSLRASALIPLTEPYSNAPYLRPVITEINGENINSGFFSDTSHDAIIDWVYLELRSASNSSMIIATKRGLLQRDGDVVSHLDGQTPVIFTRVPSGNYFVSIKHRNHLGVMTATAYSLSPITTSIDFTTLTNVYTNASILNPPRKLSGSVYTLWTGDANSNKNVKYNGLSNDKDMVLTAVGGFANINATLFNVYRQEDVNLDGRIRYNGLNSDRITILTTIGTSSPNNVYHQHTPN